MITITAYELDACTIEAAEEWLAIASEGEAEAFTWPDSSQSIIERAGEYTYTEIAEEIVRIESEALFEETLTHFIPDELIDLYAARQVDLKNDGVVDSRIAGRIAKLEREWVAKVAEQYPNVTEVARSTIAARVFSSLQP